MNESHKVELLPPKTAPELFCDWPGLVNDDLVGAKDISDFMGCTIKHVHYLAGTRRPPIEKLSGTLRMRKSVFLAYLFALSDHHCKWSPDERALVQMYLAVRKATAFTYDMDARQLTVADLDADQLLCWAGAMQDVADTTRRVLLTKEAQNGLELTEFEAALIERLPPQSR